MRVQPRRLDPGSYLLVISLLNHLSLWENKLSADNI